MPSALPLPRPTPFRCVSGSRAGYCAYCAYLLGLPAFRFLGPGMGIALNRAPCIYLMILKTTDISPSGEGYVVGGR